MALIDFKTLLQSILEAYRSGTEESRTLAEIVEKIENGKATYAEIYKAAMEHGRILNRSLSKNLLRAVTGSEKILPEMAEAVIKPPMVIGAKEIGKLAAKVQTALNQKADIGIGFIEPQPNLDQINGIISGLCQAESYEAGEPAFLSRVGNYLEGYVDDCVHDNAKFHYDAGLDSKIERVAAPDCCEWCSALAGIYDYSKVSNTGNDVFRRHRNCHCQVLFSPSGSSKRRQNVHDKRWTGNESELRERQLHYSEKREFQHDYKKINARKVTNYSENNLWIDQGANLSPREVRRINRQISQAKELHGVVGKCNSPFVIVSDSSNLASYNPRTDTFFINSKLGNEKDILKIQQGYACQKDRRSTMVHEIFHWKDAEDYRSKVGPIEDASSGSVYTAAQNYKAREELKSVGIDFVDVNSMRSISEYAKESILDNDYEEAYTEYRTQVLIEGGVKR